MIFSDFNNLLGQALTPITLISGVGVLMLCLTGRYNHASDRIRQLIEKREASGMLTEPDLDDEIDLIYRRARLLRMATIYVVLSAVCSSLMVLIGVLSGMLGHELVVVESALLILAIAFIITSTSFFAMEISISLHALSLVIAHLPDLPPLEERNNSPLLLEQKKEK